MTLENTTSNKENIEKTKDTKKIDKNLLVKEFVLESTNNDKISFLDEVFKCDILDWKIKDDLSNFIKKKSSWNETLIIDIYSNFDLSTIKIGDIKLEAKKYLIQLNTKRKNLSLVLSNEFDLENNDSSKFINEQINKQSEIKLNDLLKSKKERDDFLFSILWKEKIPLTKSKASIFEKIPNLKEKLWTKNLKNSDKLEEILKILDSRNKSLHLCSNEISALEELLSYDFLENSFKKQIIKDFLPVISFKDVKSISLDFDEKKLKEDIVKEIFSEEDIDSIWLENLVSKINENDLYLETDKLLSKDKNISKIIKKFSLDIVTNFSKDFNKSLDIEDESIKENWPQDLEWLKKELEKLNKSKTRPVDTAKFSEWNFIELQKKDKTWTIVSSQYLKILNTNEEKKELSFLVVWNEDSINTNLEWEWKTISYVDFLANMKKSNSNLISLDEDDIDNKIKDPTDSLGKSELKLFKIEDLNNENDKEKYSNFYREKIEDELKKLNQELENDKDSTLLKARIKEQEEKLEKLNKIGDEKNVSELLDFLNFQKFLEKMDDIDPEWKKIWFKKDMFFESKWWIYKVTWINDWVTIDLESKAWKEYGISFDIFYNTFKKNKAKRLETITNFSSLIESKNTDESWKNHEIKDWKIIAKNAENLWETKDRKVDFLVSNDNDNLLKINYISWDTVRVQFWTRKDYSDLEDKKEKKKYDWKDGEIIYLDNNEITLNLNELDLYISQNKLHPNWKTWKQVQKSDWKDPENNFKASFWSRYFDRISINELIAWWTMLIDSFKESLKTWNDLHAAKVALAMWSFLPWDIKSDLTIKVERAESEEMDKALDWLGKVDSPIAVWRIKKWLLNSDTPEYRKEAAIMFMLSKYWHLTAKWALYEFRWKWLWYEALGWKINDELFIKTKEETAKANITFDEEYLVHILLKKQCSWNLKPKRRSRLHKDYENKWKSWINEEFDKWYWDAEKKRNASDMINWWMDEATWWTTSNAVWWYKKALERWDSLEKMTEWFFALLYSWALYNINQATLLKIQSLFYNDWAPMILTAFSSNKSDIDLLNKTVLELSKRIWEIYPNEFSSIWTEATSIFNDTINNEWSEKSRLDNSLNFWKKYWKILSRSLNFVNSKEDKYSKTDKIILFEKDNNSVFSSYYDKVRAYSWAIDFKEDYMTDSFSWAWVTWLNPYQVALKTLKMHQSWGFMNDKNWSFNWKELSDDIYSVKNKIFDPDSVSPETEKNRILQKKYLLSNLRDIISAIVENAWWNKNAMEAYNKLTTDIWYDLTKWWVDLIKDFSKQSSTKIREWKSDDLLLKIVDNILDWNMKDIDTSFSNDPFSEIITNSKKAVDRSIE